MSSFVTFWILVGTVVLIAALFFQVVKPLVLPLFMGAVLAILFRPLFIRFVRICRGRMRLAAALSTAAVVVIAVGPVIFVADVAIRQGSEYVREKFPRPAASKTSTEEETATELPVSSQQEAWLDILLHSETAQKIITRLSPYGITEHDVHVVAIKVVSWIGGQVGPRAFDFVGQATRFVIDTFLLVIALYFYFADGPRMLKTLEELTPLPPGRGAELFWEFENVCRAVVVAMFATAAMNGVLSGLGFLLVGMPHVLFLSIMMTVMSFIPFIGMATVWGAVAIYLYLEGHPGSAIFVVIWCGGFVNTLDHFVKPYIIGGRAKLHPLLVFVSVFGGIHLLGILGIFVGPIIGAVLYALLKILRAELSRSEAQSGRPSFIEEKWAAMLRR